MGSTRLYRVQKNRHRLLSCFFILLSLSSLLRPTLAQLPLTRDTKGPCAHLPKGIILSYDGRSDALIPWGPAFRRVNRAYAKRHDYEYVFLETSKYEGIIPPYWVKVFEAHDIVQRVFGADDSSNRCDDFVFSFLDTDAPWHAHEVSLESLFPERLSVENGGGVVFAPADSIGVTLVLPHGTAFVIRGSKGRRVLRQWRGEYEKWKHLWRTTTKGGSGSLDWICRLRPKKKGKDEGNGEKQQVGDGSAGTAVAAGTDTYPSWMNNIYRKGVSRDDGGEGFAVLGSGDLQRHDGFGACTYAQVGYELLPLLYLMLKNMEIEERSEGTSETSSTTTVSTSAEQASGENPEGVEQPPESLEETRLKDRRIVRFRDFEPVPWSRFNSYWPWAVGVRKSRRDNKYYLSIERDDDQMIKAQNKVFTIGRPATVKEDILLAHARAAAKSLPSENISLDPDDGEIETHSSPETLKRPRRLPNLIHRAPSLAYDHSDFGINGRVGPLPEATHSNEFGSILSEDLPNITPLEGATYDAILQRPEVFEMYVYKKVVHHLRWSPQFSELGIEREIQLFLNDLLPTPKNATGGKWHHVTPSWNYQRSYQEYALDRGAFGLPIIEDSSHLFTQTLVPIRWTLCSHFHWKWRGQPPTSRRLDYKFFRDAHRPGEEKNFDSKVYDGTSDPRDIPIAQVLSAPFIVLYFTRIYMGKFWPEAKMDEFPQWWDSRFIGCSPCSSSQKRSKEILKHMNITGEEPSSIGSMAAWLMNAEGRLNFTEQQSLIQILLSLMRVDLARHLYPREGGVKERVFDRVVEYYEKLVGAEIEDPTAPTVTDSTVEYASTGSDSSTTAAANTTEFDAEEDQISADMSKWAEELHQLLLDTSALVGTVSQESVEEYLSEQTKREHLLKAEKWKREKLESGGFGESGQPTEGAEGVVAA